MKVLHVIQTLAPRLGGPVAVLKSLVKAQKETGLVVTVYATNTNYPNGIYCDPGERNLEDFGGATVVFHKVDFHPLRYSRSLAHIIKTTVSRFDIIHIHGLYRFPPTYAAYVARKNCVPYIIQPHGSLDPFIFKRSRYSLTLKRMYERLFDIPNLNHASAIHYTAQEEAERAAFLNLRAKPVIVPNCIDWKNYKHLPACGDFRQRLRLNDQTPLVLFLGRVNFKKGLDLLVPSFVRVVRKYPEAHLAIVGPDNEGYGSKVKKWCGEQGIQDKVFFVDYIGPEAVKQAYVDADVIVLPSYAENFGMTVVEAMACGCPVVISDRVNIWREIQEEGAGFVVGLDSREIAQAICRVLLDKDAARNMGARGRLAAERRYALPRIVDEMTKIYRELITKNAIGKRCLKK